MRNYLIYILSIIFISVIFCSDCTDPNACNYNSNADIDDGSCYYPIECPNNLFECDVDDCTPPEGFDWDGQSNLFFLFVDLKGKGHDVMSRVSRVNVLDRYYILTRK